MFCWRRKSGEVFKARHQAVTFIIGQNLRVCGVAKYRAKYSTHSLPLKTCSKLCLPLNFVQMQLDAVGSRIFNSTEFVPMTSVKREMKNNFY